MSKKTSAPTLLPMINAAHQALAKMRVRRHEAQQGVYGTIVVGRRGLSKVQDFTMGRVSNKVLHIAKNNAVSIVS